MIETILKFLNRYAALLPTNIGIPQDKQAHFISGAALAIFFIVLQFPPVYAAVMVSIIGVVKEIYDHYHPLLHTADIYDWLATTLGGLAAFMLWWIV